MERSRTSIGFTFQSLILGIWRRYTSMLGAKGASGYFRPTRREGSNHPRENRFLTSNENQNKGHGPIIIRFLSDTLQQNLMCFVFFDIYSLYGTRPVSFSCLERILPENEKKSFASVKGIGACGQKGASEKKTDFLGCHAARLGYESRIARSERSSVGRALPCQGKCRQFEPDRSLQFFP